MPPEYYPCIFAAFAFVTGAAIGSFLNVCIYRLPLGLSVNEPKRSFCPNCKYPIPFSKNLPLISWIALGGKCANCKKPIPFRYFGVELLTALMFLAVWLRWGGSGEWYIALSYWVFVSLLIVATFIDFEHFIIPDEITWGGVGAGIVLSTAVPALMGQDVFWKGALWATIGAATGYGLLRAVVELGRLAFGKKKIKFETVEKFTWKHLGEDAELKVGEDTLMWSEIFSWRDNDLLILDCASAEISGKQYTNVPMHFYFSKLLVDGTEYKVDDLRELSGEVREIIIPREAMGLGDVKFIAAIGAFLGWQSVFFTIASASMVGAICGSAMLFFKKPSKIPFGPYLTLGALIWMFAGWQILHWYLNFVMPADMR